MSDSDDTDVLLLIPPDFFNIRNCCANSSSDLASVESYSQLSWGCRTPDFCSMNRQYFNYNNAPYGENVLPHSTPIKPPATNSISRPQHPVQIAKESLFLNEIDTFLQTDGMNYQEFKGRSPENSIIDVNNMSMNEFQSINASDFGKFKKPVVLPVSAKSNLLSLNEIWGSNSSSSDKTLCSLQEEKLRRQHLERNIQSLQSKLLEYDQKIAVAINVDQNKNHLIRTLEEEVLNLKQKIHDTELKFAEEHEKFLAENAELKSKNLYFEKELADTISIVKKLQERNESLENKVEVLSTANNDVNEIHKRQLRDLEIRLSNSIEGEKGLEEKISDLIKLNENLKADLEFEKAKTVEYARMKSESNVLKQQTETIKRKQTDLLSNNEELKGQVKELKEQLQTGNEEKKNLLKELDVQRLSLKKYYQSQVEDVVADKLKEFQNQLNNVEDQLKEEANRREKLIAERAIKQMELIKQANEQEISLLDEKHKEEISIYRLQLAHSAKTIHELEEKLSNYQSKRADIAERLHGLMEAQWQKALQILTSPSATFCEEDELSGRINRFKMKNFDKEEMDGVKIVRNIAENEVFQTPSKLTLPQDVLHNYIELLLRKSPKDLDSLNDILSSCKESNFKKETSSCSKTTMNNAKTPKPWK